MKIMHNVIDQRSIYIFRKAQAKYIINEMTAKLARTHSGRAEAHLDIHTISKTIFTA